MNQARLLLSIVSLTFVPTTGSRLTGFPTQAIRFTLFEHFKSFLGKEESISRSMLAGAAAGAVSVFLTQPVDVVKSNMQGLLAAEYRSSLHCARQLVARDGFVGLYKGLGARLTTVIVETSLVFTFYGE